jgi:hypothetical protein
MPAEMRLFPLALLIAALSVLLSRVTEFHPGVIFGFVGSTVITASGSSHREEGLTVWIPLFGLLLVSIVAMALITPLRGWSSSDDVWTTIPETVAIAVFVGGGQSVLLSLLPFRFNDGHKIWQWSRIAWIAVALPAAFIFFHALINPDSDYGDLAAQTKIVLMIAICAGLLAFAVALWVYFNLRDTGLRGRTA